MHKSERIFLETIADKSKTYIYAPRQFKLYDTVYTPDFYCVEDDEYIEVVLTSYQPIKYEAMSKLYPEIKLKVIKLPGAIKKSTSTRLSLFPYSYWSESIGEYRLKQIKKSMLSVEEIRQRLEDRHLTKVAAKTGLSYNTVKALSEYLEGEAK